MSDKISIFSFYQENIYKNVNFDKKIEDWLQSKKEKNLSVKILDVKHSQIVVEDKKNNICPPAVNLCVIIIYKEKKIK